ncbi:hypothetical protein DIURU_000290 [Diutina rugosa]|uniref:Altered inheritance of mitochondria protein 21 n=1 Tax=Diutina rugosa TaxID=5481 RepID=A0A642UYV7_DIURU|nr:uncharacterized protein DIURU_000290 [Diutina rugosa]KAA8908069.1 hypothetical protein DIURU_000290 [Diutina rugosa]
MSTPPIPSRPAKQAATPAGDTASDNGDPLVAAPPQVPRRPNRDPRPDPDATTPETDSPRLPPPSETDAGADKPIPEVPSRPGRRTNTTESVTSESTAELTTEPAPSKPLERSSSTAMSESSIIDAYAATPHRDSIPIPEQSGLAGGGNDDDDDGDKTPGNTEPQVSMKVEEDEPIPGGPEDSSFDDDQETVSQDVEDQRDRNHMVSTSSPAPSAESRFGHPEATPVIGSEATPKTTDNTSETTTEEPQTVTSSEPTEAKIAATESSGKDAAELDPVEPVDNEPVEPQPTPKQPSETVTLDKDADPKPVSTFEEIEEKVNEQPQADDEAKPVNHDDNSDATATRSSDDVEAPTTNDNVNDNDKPKETNPEQDVGDKKTSTAPGEATKPSQPIDGDKREPSTSTATPVIPKRPQRPSVPSRPAKKPSVPSLASTAAADDATAAAKPKAPPPKPKKLSSKIAAFQEMLKNPQPPARSASPPKDEGSSSRKLSADKRGFAQNLQGMMGMGVPLPGMAATPEMLRKLKSQDDDAADDDDTKPSTKVAGPRRARGPKKRLPKALEEAKNATHTPRYQISTGTLWSITPAAEPAPPLDSHRTDSIVSEQGIEEDHMSELKETVTLVDDSDTDILNASTVQSHPSEAADDATVGPREGVADATVEPTTPSTNTPSTEDSQPTEVPRPTAEESANVPHVPRRPGRPAHSPATTEGKPIHDDTNGAFGKVQGDIPGSFPEGDTHVVVNPVTRTASDLDDSVAPSVGMGSQATTEGDWIRGMFRTDSDLGSARGAGEGDFTRTSTYSSEKPDGLVTEGFSRSSTFDRPPAMTTTHEESEEAPDGNTETSSFEEITAGVDDDHFVEIKKHED